MTYSRPTSLVELQRLPASDLNFLKMALFSFKEGWTIYYTPIKCWQLVLTHFYLPHQYLTLASVSNYPFLPTSMMGMEVNQSCGKRLQKWYPTCLTVLDDATVKFTNKCYTTSVVNANRFNCWSLEVAANFIAVSWTFSNDNLDS